MGNRELTEGEKDHEYRTYQRRQGGTQVTGEEAKELDEAGTVGEVAERREKEAS